jgi:hypothetical protein
MTQAADAGTAEVLAVVRNHNAYPAVTEAAAMIARLIGVGVREVRLAAGLSPERAARQVVQALHQPGIVTGALAGDVESRPLWRRVVQQSAKPVVLVPTAARDRPPPIRRVLIPLDGTARSAAAVAATAEQLARGGAELVVLHVFDAETVPMFWDQPAHAGHTWAQEFLARYCAQPGARMELRSGAAAEHVLKVARAEKADMITLAWSQRLDPGRAPIVRRAIVEAAVPVMLVPIAPG